MQNIYTLAPAEISGVSFLKVSCGATRIETAKVLKHYSHFMSSWNEMIIFLDTLKKLLSHHKVNISWEIIKKKIIWRNRNMRHLRHEPVPYTLTQSPSKISKFCISYSKTFTLQSSDSLRWFIYKLYRYYIDTQYSIKQIYFIDISNHWYNLSAQFVLLCFFFLIRLPVSIQVFGPAHTCMKQIQQF